ncbi:MAG: head-tail connector protein [Pseudomonadota bacterium]
MTQLTVIEPAAEAPLSLDTVKAFLRIGHDGEDALIADLLEAARERLEQVAGLALVVQTVRVCRTEWPSGLHGRGARLPMAPVQQLDAVRVVDADGAAVEQTEFFSLNCGRLALRPWTVLPMLAIGAHIEIDLQVGFGAATDVPDDLREALLHLIGDMYRSRTPSGHAGPAELGLPQQVQAILDARKQVRL